MSAFRARPPAVPTVLSDDSVCRITRWDFAPGADTGVHTHGLGYVVVPMTDCHMRIEDRDGVRDVFVAQGAAYRRDAGAEHNVVNDSAEAMSFIEIEYKTA